MFGLLVFAFFLLNLQKIRQKKGIMSSLLKQKPYGVIIKAIFKILSFIAKNAKSDFFK